MTTFIFPGQGSQYRGMGDKLFDEFKELTEIADEILGYSIKQLCLNDPYSQLSQTQFTQPAIYVVNALSYLSRINNIKAKPDYVAGHSLGEYSALFAAGSFDFATGLLLTKRRGELMSQVTGGGMAAVLGLTRDEIQEILENNQLETISIANHNAPSQIVISGLRDDIERAQAIFEGAEVGAYIPLNVSGAFHSPQMYEVRKEFEDFLGNFSFSDPTIPVISNVQAKPYKSGQLKQNLIEQIDHPVRWMESIQYLIEIGEMDFKEVGPGMVLTGLISQITSEAKPIIVAAINKNTSNDKGQDLVDALTDYIREIVRDILQKEIDYNTSLDEIGFGTRSRLQLKYQLADDIDINVPLSVLGKSHSINELVEWILKTIDTCNIYNYLSMTNGKYSIDKELILRFSSNNQSNRYPEIVPDPAKQYEPFPLMDIQEAYLAAGQTGKEFNQEGCIFYVEFEEYDLDIFRLNEVWEYLVAYHDMLHAVFLPNGQQRILHKSTSYKFRVYDLQWQTEDEITAHIETLRNSMSHKVYEIGEWPLFDIAITVCNHGRSLIHFSIDESIVDASSIFKLLRQWSQIYENPTVSLPDIGITFRDFVLATKRFKDSEKYKSDLSYWIEKLDPPPQGPSLPFRNNTTQADSQLSSYRQRYYGSLDKEQWDILKNKARNLNVSPTAILLTIFNTVLSSWSKDDRFLIIQTYLNKNQLHPQIDDILGPFISTNLFIVENIDKNTFEENVLNHQEQIWNDLEHMSVSGIRVLRELRILKKAESTLLIPVVFTSLLGLNKMSSTLDILSGRSKHSWLSNVSYSITQTPQVYLDHQIFDIAGTLFFFWDVVEDYFEAGVIEEMFSEYCQLLNKLSIDEQLWNTKVTKSDFSQYCIEPSSTDYQKESIYTNDEEDIAIIGVSGRYPKARNIDEFWENLKNGRDCITEIPRDRWDYRKYYSQDGAKLGKTSSKWGGFIDDVDKFDPLFFNISPQEAELMDPQERLFLEMAWIAFEDAGYTRNLIRDKYKGRVGVFVGAMYSEYQLYGVEESLRGNDVALSPGYGSIAHRVSYFFDLNGPSIAIDTMCSSSLTTIHFAAESIKRGECDMAIVGGVNLSIHPNKYILHSQTNMASSDGRCRSFGDGGDGFVAGEGVGAVILKPLRKAQEDRDHVYAVIKSTSINHDGKTHGYMVPNPNTQATLISEALKKAKIDPRSISYIEAHGTGTTLGDPIEITGLSKAFKEYTDAKQYCSIGSVKSNIGHLEAAAGIASITKVILQMKHKQLVPSIHSEKINSNIDFDKSPFYVQHELEEWKQPIVIENEEERMYSRRAGISSFGAGGANAHVILDEYRDNKPKPFVENRGLFLFVLSAKNEKRLKVYASEVLDFLERIRRVEGTDDIAIADMIYTLQIGRESMNERLAILVSNKDELIKKIAQYCNNEFNVEDMYLGNANTYSEQREWLIDGDESEDFIKDIINKGKLDTLAQLWVSGVEIIWDLLYPKQTPNRISMPTYPFEEERYWIPVDDNNKHLFDGNNYIQESRSSTVISLLQKLKSGELEIDEVNRQLETML